MQVKPHHCVSLRCHLKAFGLLQVCIHACICVFVQMSLHMLCVKYLFVLLTAQQAAKVHPSNKAGFSYPSVSLGVQDKELTLGSGPPSSSVCVLFVTVSLALCVFLYICLSQSFEHAEEKEWRKTRF